MDANTIFEIDQLVRVMRGISDPINKQGYVGIITGILKYGGLKVRFQDGKTGIYEDDTLEHVGDDYNADLIFSTTVTYLLVKIACGDIDLKYLALEELTKRGLNEAGEWIAPKK